MAKRIQKKKYSKFDYMNDIGMNSRRTLYKEQKLLRFNEGLKYATNMPGIPLASVFAAIGGSDTGKSTLFMEIIKCCKESNQLPVYVDKEGKFNFGRAMEMGLEVHPMKCDSTTGEVISEFGDDDYYDVEGDNIGIMYDTPFIVADDNFIRDFLEDNKTKLKGDFKKKDYLEIGSDITCDDTINFSEALIKRFSVYLEKYEFDGIVFLYDSYDRLRTEYFYKSIAERTQPENRREVQMKNNLFMVMVENMVKRSKSSYYPYYITLGFIVNKYTFQATAMSRPTAKAKGGDGRKYYTDIEFYLGGKAGEGIVRQTVTVSGKEYAYATEVDIEVKKNHGNIDINSKEPVFITSHKGKLCITKEGFIPKPDLDAYKEQFKAKVKEVNAGR